MASDPAVLSFVRMAALETKLATSERRAQKAEQEAACLRERARMLEQQAEKAERTAQQLAKRASSAEARIAQAEGHAEILAETAKAAAASVERAVRAEERAAAMGDLQAKLPVLIQAVVGAMSQGQLPMWRTAHGEEDAGPIKLEFEPLQDQEQEQPGLSGGMALAVGDYPAEASMFMSPPAPTFMSPPAPTGSGL